MPQRLSRRSLMKGLLGTATAGMAGLPLHGTWFRQLANGQTTGRERGEMGRLAFEFRRSVSVPATSIAISRNGQFVYDEAIGMGYRKELQQVQQSSRFRIASLSKPITAVTIFSLIEQGKLNLTDKVFGPSGILGTNYGKPPYQQYVTDVTVDNLLTHTAGGWPDDSTDPMFRNNSWDQTKLISWTLQNLPLTNPPGQNWAYSNFGYCVLGRVIEQVTGQPYASYVQANILAPSGISDMSIARNKESERAPNEVTYVGQYSKTAFPTDMVYGNHGYAGLNLVTCGGVFDSATGHYLSNIVVFTEKVG